MGQGACLAPCLIMPYLLCEKIADVLDVLRGSDHKHDEITIVLVQHLSTNVELFQSLVDVLAGGLDEIHAVGLCFVHVLIIAQRYTLYTFLRTKFIVSRWQNHLAEGRGLPLPPGASQTPCHDVIRPVASVTTSS